MSKSGMKMSTTICLGLTGKHMKRCVAERQIATFGKKDFEGQEHVTPTYPKVQNCRGIPLDRILMRSRYNISFLLVMEGLRWPRVLP